MYGKICNYGIADFASRRLFETLYGRRKQPLKNLTTFNLGYDEAATCRYPWAGRLPTDVVPARALAHERCRP